MCRELSVPCLQGDELSNTGLGKRGMLFDQTHSNEAGNREIAFRIGQCMDPGLMPSGRGALRNLAVDARGFLRKWSPVRSYRRMAKRQQGKKKREASKIPSDTYTLY